MKITANTFYQAFLDAAKSGKENNLALVYGKMSILSRNYLLRLIFVQLIF